VLATAEELFTERGIEATKIDDICEAADVAKRTLCNHFPTKAHIVQALSREAVSRMVASIDDAREAGATTRERIRILFDGFFGAAHGTPEAAEGEIRVSDAVQALLAEGGPEQLPPGASVETFAEVVLGSIYATTLEWVHRDDYDVEARTSEVGRFLASLLPPG